jgi:hypothetical protein
VLGEPGKGKSITNDYAEQFKTDTMPGFSTIWNKRCAGRSGEEKADVITALIEHFAK